MIISVTVSFFNHLLDATCFVVYCEQSFVTQMVPEQLQADLCANESHCIVSQSRNGRLVESNSCLRNPMAGPGTHWQAVLLANPITGPELPVQ